MRALALAVALTGGLAPPTAAQVDTLASLSPGVTIDRSVVVRPGVYPLAAPTGADPAAAIRIAGEGIVVDLTGVELVGSPPGTPPDSFSGVAIRVDGGRDVTVRGVRARGYKVGLLARGTRNLRVTEADFSRNWRPRLWSGIEGESLLDWLTYHANDTDEWLRYGAGIYLMDVVGGSIDHVVATHNQNGLLLSRTDSVAVWNDDFSWNSGLGIGLYRSRGNRVMHNRADWDIRGYSHGFYNRGQDSAGILLYEQSSGNVVAYNSATHGGDGFFLWAGNSTMETGRGGSNDNRVYGNDFSHASNNAIEATFSRNVFAANRAEESDYGLWGGYSWETLVIGNRFARNRIGLAIEHGQDNRILHNTFSGDSSGIRLWARESQPADWGYARNRDVASRDVEIRDNRFDGHRVALALDDTRSATVERNGFFAVDTLAILTGARPGLVFRENDVLWTAPAVVDSPPGLEGWGANFAWPDAELPGGRADAAFGVRSVAGDPSVADSLAPGPIPGGVDPRIPPGGRRGRRWIVVDEWGPYDYRSPKLWPAGSPAADPLTLRVLGPPGRWRLVRAEGVDSATPDSGAVPGEIVVHPGERTPVDWTVELEYRGGEVVTTLGERIPAGETVPFSFARFHAPVDWRVRFFRWDESTDPRERPDAFARLLAGEPILERPEERLAYLWYRPRIEGLPQERWAFAADGAVELPPGRYELVTVSDDALRLWVDGELTIDRWDPHEPEVAVAPLEGGRHDLRAEYYQVGGWVELKIEIRPADRPGRDWR